MKRDEWIGHSTARRKFTEDDVWLYEDASIQSFVIFGSFHGVDLPLIDGFIEQLEAKGAGAGAELRERRHKAWEGKRDKQVFLRHMEWIILRRNEIMREEALYNEIKRLKREGVKQDRQAITEPLPVLPAAVPTEPQPQEEESGILKRERQIRAIEAEAKKAGYDALKIKTGCKTTLRKACKASLPLLFGAGDDPFNDAWADAIKCDPPRLQMADHNKFAGK